MRSLAALMTVLLLPVLALAGEADGVKAFRDGLDRLRAGNHTDAAESFARAYADLPVIADYALLYMSRAFLAAGEEEKSVAAANRLLMEFSDSPLRREASRVAISNAITGDWDRAITMLEEHARAFPGDGEMILSYADLLIKRGEREKAEPFLKELYIGAGRYSPKAYEILGTREFTAEDLLRLGDNLMERKEYSSAEQALRQALAASGPTMDQDVTRRLGLALYKQKKYVEAAKLFLETDDLYMAAKSFLRAGEIKAFESTLDQLKTAMDPEAVELLAAKALEKLNDGESGEALRVLAEASSLFPDNSEKALWYSGWINYKLRNYREAERLFVDLYDKYKSPKYLYWRARAVERSGGEAEQLFKDINDDGFYGLLAKEKTGSSIAVGALDNPPPRQRIRLPRMDALASVGLTDECASELERLANRVSETDMLIEISYRLADMNRYNRALYLLSRLPEDQRPADILYPKAYWDIVADVSSENGIDPLLLLSIIREESRFDPEALSPSGAIGLMQLMPQTAGHLSGLLKMETEGRGYIYDVPTNIKLGAYYLSRLLGEFKSISPALAAYNAGEHKVRKWLEENSYESSDEFIEDIPYVETRNYTKRIITTYFRYLNNGSSAQAKRAGTL